MKKSTISAPDIYRRRLPLSTIDIGSHGDAPLMYLLPTFTLNHFQLLYIVQHQDFLYKVVLSYNAYLRLNMRYSCKYKSG